MSWQQKMKPGATSVSGLLLVWTHVTEKWKLNTQLTLTPSYQWCEFTKGDWARCLKEKGLMFVLSVALKLNVFLFLWLFSIAVFLFPAHNKWWNDSFCIHWKVSFLINTIDRVIQFSGSFLDDDCHKHVFLLLRTVIMFYRMSQKSIHREMNTF